MSQTLFPAPGVGRLHQRGAVLGRTAVASLLVMHGVVATRAALGWAPPWPISLIALFAMFVVPMRLLGWKIDWYATSRAEQLVYALATVLLGLIVGGLLLNTVLPPLGVRRPLDSLPVLAAFDLAMIALTIWRRDRVPPRPRVLTSWVPFGRGDVGVFALALAALALVAVGATRLNNGAGGGATLIGLICAGTVWAALLVRRYRLHPGTIHATVYVLGLGMLLMTSLRGWLITGHDVQREYRLFQRVLEDGVWSIGTFRDPYNACLSVTVLPTMIRNVTGLEPVYVMKLVPDLVFAVCPVIVYLIAERFVTRGPALLGVLTFVAFPTYFADMPFLTRQEYAFLFLATGMLVATNLRLSVLRRRVMFGCFSAGVVLTHYSTTYVLIGVLAIAWVIHAVLRASHRLLPRRVRWLNRSAATASTRARDVRFVLGAVNIIVLVAITLVWSQVVTQTNGQLQRTLTASVQGLLHPGAGEAKSSDTRYNFFGGGGVDPAQRLADYRAQTLADTAQGRAAGVFLPLASVSSAPTPVAPLADLPLTAVGSALTGRGVDVTAVNSLLRGVSARLLQLFVCIGMGAVVFGYRRRIRASSELTILAGASFVVVLSQVVLPALSVDYGVLRAFQQSLFLLAPFLAIGMIVTVSWLRRLAPVAAGAFGLVFFGSLTGVLPQLTGGYPAQLHLNNAGQYYDIYYTQPAELRAAQWMLGQVAREGWSVDGNVQTDRFTFNRVQAFTALDTASEIYPTQLRSQAYTLLGSATVVADQASIGYEGDVIAYRYPLSVLTSTKDLVYSNGHADVFR